MKGIKEIREDNRVIVKTVAEDGINGWVTMKGKTFRFVASFGGGWDHVSVSLQKRCPTWEEMCIIKDIFFRENECCVEYHPAKMDYVNLHPYCLHIWKPQGVDIPKPPKIFV